MVNFLALDQYRACVALVSAGQDLDEGRLARTIVTEEALRLRPDKDRSEARSTALMPPKAIEMSFISISGVP